MKTCNHCHQELDESQFNKWKNNPDGSGLAKRCRECSHELNKKYHLKHFTEIQEKRKEYFKERYTQKVRKPHVKHKPHKKTPFVPPANSSLVRCKCWHPIYILPGQRSVLCEKCRNTLKILNVPKSNRHRSGIILRVI